MNTIKNEANYKAVMAKINGLMTKGSDHVTREEKEEIRRLALAAQTFEQNKFVMDFRDNYCRND